MRKATVQATLVVSVEVVFRDISKEDSLFFCSIVECRKQRDSGIVFFVETGSLLWFAEFNGQ